MRTLADLNQPNRVQQQAPPDLLPQIYRFWAEVGIFSKIVLVVCIGSMIAQLAVFRDFNQIGATFGVCYSPVVDASQLYRIVTAEFTHGNAAHILFNSSAILIFGKQLEPLYGTLFYSALNAWLALVSNGFALLFRHAMIYWVPKQLGGHIKYMTTCSVGYSNVLFGLLTIGCCQGDRFVDLWGIKLPKVIMPFVLLIANSIMVPNSDVVGHFTGIIAAFFVKYCGFYLLRLLPQ